MSYVGTFSWVEPVLSNRDEVSCSMTQHRAPDEHCDQESRTLITELTVLPSNLYFSQSNIRHDESGYLKRAYGVTYVCFNGNDIKKKNKG